jgi:hypothetical protein
MTLSEIETAIFRVIAQCLKQLRYCVHQLALKEDVKIYVYIKEMNTRQYMYLYTSIKIMCKSA